MAWVAVDEEGYEIISDSYLIFKDTYFILIL